MLNYPAFRNDLKIIIILFNLILSSLLPAQTPGVTSISPAFNEIASTINPQISVAFNVPMDSSTFNYLSFSVLGERSGYHTGQISFSGNNTVVSFSSNTKYNSGEPVKVTLSHKIKSLQGDTLEGFAWEFRIPSKPTAINFSRPVSYGGGGFGLQCIDMNNDGYPDIVTSSGVIRINDGKGNLPTAWVLNDADGFAPIIVDDFNRDGFMDVVYRGSDGLKIGLGDGKGNFKITTKPFWFGSYISADLNNDGYPDIAGTMGSEGDTSKSYLKWGISFNDGSGNFNDTVMYKVSDGGLPINIISADVDNDGNTDVIIVSAPAPSGTFYPYGINGLIVCINDGKGNFDKTGLYSLRHVQAFDQSNLYMADFNNDGYIDISDMDYRGEILLNHKDGTFSEDTSYMRTIWGAEDFVSMTGGDINGDGLIDIIISGYSFPLLPDMPVIYYTVLKNDDSYFMPPAQINFSDSLPRSSYSVAAADLNGDGYLDIVHSGSGVFVTLHSDTITSVKNNPAQVNNFKLYQNYPNPFNPSTTIEYQLNRESKITISVYNILGEKLKELYSGIKPGGKYKTIFNASGLPSGIYLIAIETPFGYRVQKSIYLK